MLFADIWNDSLDRGRPFTRLTSPQDKKITQAYFLASIGIRIHNLIVAAMKFIDRAATRFGCV
jgi:hypothetical protein